MAEEAHKEPTMEEILASIRKIISEDDDKKTPGAEANQLRPEEIVTEEVAPEDEGLSLDALANETPEEDDMFEEFDLSDIEGDGLEPEPAAEPLEPEIVMAESEAEFETFEEEFDVPEAPDESLELEDTFEMTEPEPVFEEEPVVASFVEPEPTPPSIEVPAEETMQALTEESTEAAAAGALAKLVAKMDMGSENTLEGMVRQLVKPMIKEWLDANLPAIVEDKVEAEVQRIARLAR